MAMRLIDISWFPHEADPGIWVGRVRAEVDRKAVRAGCEAQDGWSADPVDVYGCVIDDRGRGFYAVEQRSAHGDLIDCELSFSGLAAGSYLLSILLRTRDERFEPDPVTVVVREGV